MDILPMSTEPSAENTRVAGETNNTGASLAAMQDEVFSAGAQKSPLSLHRSPSYTLDELKLNDLQITNNNTPDNKPPAETKSKELIEYKQPLVDASSHLLTLRLAMALKKQFESGKKDKVNDKDKIDNKTKPEEMSKFDFDLFNAINEWRAKKGLRKLEYSSKMQDKAEANNKAMAKAGRLGHLAYGGYEVAGMGYGSPKAALRGWINSPAHLAIISNPNLRKMGADGNTKWQTAHFS
jgi:uncharacterized protein YkwD